MRYILILITIFLFYTFLFAEKEGIDSNFNRDIFNIETIVVPGSAISGEKEEIESSTLKLHKVVDLSEILSDELVEIQMIRKSMYGNEVSIRGFGQENMKVFLDGGVIEGACGSRKDPSLSHINPLMVEKIVVQEGPFDVTKLGSLGGYIDITTKKPNSSFEGEILGKAGSYGFNSSGFVIGGGTEKIKGSLGYNFSESDQYKDGAGERVWEKREGLQAAYNKRGKDLKAFQKSDIWGKVEIYPLQNHTMSLEHTYGKGEDILTPRALFDIDEEISNLSKVSWEIKNLGVLSDKITISMYRNDVEHLPFQKYRNVSAPKNNKAESIINGGTIQNITKTDFANFIYGFDFYFRDWWADVYNTLTNVKINDNLIPSVESKNFGGYFQMNKVFDKMEFGFGLRYDLFQQQADEELIFTKFITNENSQTDNLLGGNISFKYFFDKDTMFFGGIGRSYRTPTSIERYIQSNSKFFGNPCIEPTANTEFDLGFKCIYGNWMLQSKVFYSFLKDYIYQEKNLSGYKSYTNIDAHIFGGDIKVITELGYRFSLESGLAYQVGRKDSFPDNNMDRDLGQIAPLKGKLSLNYNKNDSNSKSGAFGTLELIHSEAAVDVDTDVGEKKLPAWDIVNLRVGYQFRAFNLNIGVDNIFDKEYAVANSYEWDALGGSGANPSIINEPGRFIYLTIGYNF